MYAFLAASEPGVVHAWDLRTRRPLHTAHLETDHRWPGARELSIVGGHSLISAHADQGQVKIWDATTGRMLSSFTVSPPPDFAGLGFFGCRPVLFAGHGLESKIRVVDPRTGRDQAAPIAVTAAGLSGTTTFRGRTIARLSNFTEGASFAQAWDLTARRAIAKPVVEEDANELKLAANDRYVVGGRPLPAGGGVAAGLAMTTEPYRLWSICATVRRTEA
ncbi:WD40 repeat domain-containing protein [Nonomuraea sp. KC401]|uniref:WD40 repeat domain-containing protein n=1 Tax=unclassified Nonomuraea TaxID=2593643 RepID=UPI0010FD1E3B|nr:MULTISPECIES: WD40 repeat domain-containing protein [unclassified Nonomuraea]NBE97273.1 hypothetical protein [Nonomuraea sp. K271]TLF65870.1 WD40 repeat domain-containing protein [Nonomuraea sp. KC401]